MTDNNDSGTGIVRAPGVLTPPKALILTGLGINCNDETEYAFRLCNADTEQVHVNRLIGRDRRLSDYQIFVLPGGFLHSDAIESGRIMANILKTELLDDIREFIEAGKPVLAICNGYQVLVKAGILPGLDGEYAERVTLVGNDSGRFEDRWVYLREVEGNKCIWTQGTENIYLPVRHGEGKFVPESDELLARLYDENIVVFKYVGKNGEANPGYPWNPNGAVDDIAAICNPTGNVLGMMPHPEGHIFTVQHPRWTREHPEGDYGPGLEIVRKGVQYARQL